MTKRITAKQYRELGGESESETQQRCVRWFKMCTAGTLASLLYAIPNGGSRHKLEAVKMKREGTTAGVPDLHLEVPSADGMYSSLYIEMKTPFGKVQKTQMEWAEKAGIYSSARCIIVRSYEEFRYAIYKHLDVSGEAELIEKYYKK